VPSLVGPIAEEYEGKVWQGYVVNKVVQSHLEGSVGDTIRVQFRTGSNDTVSCAMPLVEQKGRVFQLGYFPPFYVWIEVDTLNGNIGYIAFNGFLDPGRLMPVFNESVASFMDADGIIVDLRGNPGGIIAMVTGMAGWFVEEKARHLGTITMRDNTIKAVVYPRSIVYTGPLAVLIDGLSASSSEIFAGGMKDLGRARLFGTRTAGAVLPSAIEGLPNGDGFQYAFANYRSEGGDVLEGVGVTPHVEVQHTREALLEGRDLVLEAAMAWIRDQ
jgi:carboxyl-terminal processing protease